MSSKRGPAAPTDTPPKRGRRPKPDALRTPSGAISRAKGIRERGPGARSEHIGCRLTKADAKALEAAAKASGCTASEWVRDVVVAALRPVVRPEGLTSAYLFAVIRPADGQLVGYEFGSEPTSTGRMDEIRALVQAAKGADYADARAKLLRWAAQHPAICSAAG